MDIEPNNVDLAELENLVESAHQEIEPERELLQYRRYADGLISVEEWNYNVSRMIEQRMIAEAIAFRRGMAVAVIMSTFLWIAGIVIWKG